MGNIYIVCMTFFQIALLLSAPIIDVVYGAPGWAYFLAFIGVISGTGQSDIALKLERKNDQQG